MPKRKRIGIPRLGRQSQMGYRFPDIGWKIVSAHVSFLPEDQWEMLRKSCGSTSPT